LLLRLGVGIALICLGTNGLLETIEEPISLARHLVETTGGIFFVAGLWTPAVGALIAINELWVALSLYSSPRDGHWIHILLAVLTTGVAMLGPGAWSVDARLFGRKRFDI
jgi:uncharacterized membrane protein YphA (DoxX/SURF4 family)